jgi:undecaprenyl pyrophosphate phosphatase UppP
MVALAAVKFFVRYLERGKLAPFAWYRILAAPVFYILTRGINL